MIVSPQNLPVTVIGGYLGAGKTTLVNHLLRHANGRRIAVAVNEFGALPIDSDLIEAADGNVLTLAGGCICCSFGSDLIAGLIDLVRRADRLDHILIEASGVALPGAIAQSVSLVAGLALDAIVVVVDAETVRARAADPYMGDTIARQLADADLVIVNKTDLVAVEALERLTAWLPSLVPRGHLVPITFGAVDADVVLGIGSGFDASTQRSAHVVHAFESISLDVAVPVDATRLAKALAQRDLGLVRAKGIVRDLDGTWKLVQVVGRRAEVSIAPFVARAALVCIAHGRPLDRAGLERALAAARDSG